MMDWKLELVIIPVSDADRARDFYAATVGFHLDHDHRVSDDVRFIQLTPVGSGCSIALGDGLTDAPPGSVKGLQLVVDDIHAAGMSSSGAECPASARSRCSVGSFVKFSDPDGNGWSVQQIPAR